MVRWSIRSHAQPVICNSGRSGSFECPFRLGTTYAASRVMSMISLPDACRYIESVRYIYPVARRRVQPSVSRALVGPFESGERHWDGGEFGAVAKALKVDPDNLFTRFMSS